MKSSQLEQGYYTVARTSTYSTLLNFSHKATRKVSLLAYLKAQIYQKQ